MAKKILMLGLILDTNHLELETKNMGKTNIYNKQDNMETSSLVLLLVQIPSTRVFCLVPKEPEEKVSFHQNF